MNVFILPQNISDGYLLEAPDRGASFEYPQETNFFGFKHWIT